MSVYIDPQMSCMVSKAWRWPVACHLFADSVAELHLFAASIGLRREWFQLTHGTFAHYDLNESRRAKAIAAGAIELDRRAAVAKWHELGLRPRRAKAGAV